MSISSSTMMGFAWSISESSRTGMPAADERQACSIPAMSNAAVRVDMSMRAVRMAGRLSDQAAKMGLPGTRRPADEDRRNLEAAVLIAEAEQVLLPQPAHDLVHPRHLRVDAGPELIDLMPRHPPPQSVLPGQPLPDPRPAAIVPIPDRGLRAHVDRDHLAGNLLPLLLQVRRQRLECPRLQFAIRPDPHLQLFAAPVPKLARNPAQGVLEVPPANGEFRMVIAATVLRARLDFDERVQGIEMGPALHVAQQDPGARRTKVGCGTGQWSLLIRSSVTPLISPNRSRRICAAHFSARRSRHVSLRLPGKAVSPF